MVVYIRKVLKHAFGVCSGSLVDRVVGVVYIEYGPFSLFSLYIYTTLVEKHLPNKRKRSVGLADLRAWT